MDAVEEGGAAVRRKMEEMQREWAEMRRRVGELERMVRERGRRRRCVVLMDSNGRGVTPDTIGDFLGGEEREKWEIQVVQAFTLREAWERLRRGDIGVEGARVVVDCVTNYVRGTRRQGRVEPGEVAERLRRVIGEMGGAEEVVVCEVKPMQHGGESQGSVEEEKCRARGLN